MLQPTTEHASKHYTEDLAKRRGQHVRDLMIEMLTSGPVVAVCLEGVEAVEMVRKMVGTTEPKAAAPGTIRGDYSHVSFKHADEKKSASTISSTPQAVWKKPKKKSKFGLPRRSCLIIVQDIPRIPSLTRLQIVDWPPIKIDFADRTLNRFKTP